MLQQNYTDVDADTGTVLLIKTHFGGIYTVCGEICNALNSAFLVLVIS